MKKYSFLLVSGLALFLTSCLKDKNVEDGLYGMEGADASKLTELPTGYQSFSFDFKDQPLDVQIVEVRLTSKDLAKQDITVALTLANSASLISDYNTEHGTSFVTMPANLYTLPATGLNVTIPAGQRSGFLAIKTNAINFDPSSTYALGFTIASVSDASYSISGNFYTKIVSMGAKNQYDGEYTVQFTNYHPSSNPGYIGTTTTVYMVTTSGNTVKIYMPAFAGFYCPAVLGGALTAFSAQEPAYTINATTNAVTVQNAYSGATTFYSMAPGFNSRYVPATKEIFAKWGYGSGGPYPPFDAGTTREWTQHFTYVGPRP
ncbi:MAG TPA: DUF1735 domain-containing protein [Chitinophagaceae bacterium]